MFTRQSLNLFISVKQLPRNHAISQINMTATAILPTPALVAAGALHGEVLFQKQVPVVVIVQESPVAAATTSSASAATATGAAAPSTPLQRRQNVTVTVCMASRQQQQQHHQFNAYQSSASTGHGAVAGSMYASQPLPAPATHNGNLKVLRVTLTDDADPFFLYQLEIGEDDFHRLKSQQK